MRDGARAHRPLVPGRPRRLPPAHGDRAADHAGHHHPGRRRRADPGPPARGPAPGARGDHGGRHDPHGHARWPCWLSACRGSASSSTPCACCRACRTCAPPSGSTCFENGINIVAAVALVGPLGSCGASPCPSRIAYTVAAVAALVYVRTRVHGLGGDLILGPLAHVACWRPRPSSWARLWAATSRGRRPASGFSCGWRSAPLPEEAAYVARRRRPRRAGAGRRRSHPA